MKKIIITVFLIVVTNNYGPYAIGWLIFECNLTISEKSFNLSSLKEKNNQVRKNNVYSFSSIKQDTLLVIEKEIIDSIFAKDRNLILKINDMISQVKDTICPIEPFPEEYYEIKGKRTPCYVNDQKCYLTENSISILFHSFYEYNEKYKSFVFVIYEHQIDPFESCYGKMYLITLDEENEIRLLYSLAETNRNYEESTKIDGDYFVSQIISTDHLCLSDQWVRDTIEMKYQITNKKELIYENFKKIE